MEIEGGETSSSGLGGGEGGGGGKRDARRSRAGGTKENKVESELDSFDLSNN